VMELVHGPTLAAFLRQGAMDPAWVATVGSQLAEALAYVHAQGVVHRDLKPSNVLLGVDGRVRIGDFGVSRLLDSSTITVKGTTLGTVSYMAPEQLRGQRVGPAADIWSLGIVLLECLQGRRVYGGPPAEVVARRLAGPALLPDHLPAPWRLLLAGMLDEHPERRLIAPHVAGLLAVAPFAEPWPDAEPVVPTAPAPGPFRPDAPDLTAFAPGAPAPASPPLRTRRGRRALLAGAFLLALTMAAGLAATRVLGNEPTARTGAGAGGHHAVTSARPTTTTTTTATTTTTTTTTVPTGQAALDTLDSDVADAQAAGSIDPALGRQVSIDAERAVADDEAGDTGGASDLLGQASALLSQGVADGSVDPATGSTLQSDLSDLAGALRLGPGTTTTAPSPAGHGARDGRGGGPAGNGNG